MEALVAHAGNDGMVREGEELAYREWLKEIIRSQELQNKELRWQLSTERATVMFLGIVLIVMGLYLIFGG